jgi:hypothetical protein
MVMKLDKHSEEDLSICRRGCGVVFMKVDKCDIKAVEFYPSVNGSLHTISRKDIFEGKDIFEEIVGLFQESKRGRSEKKKGKEVSK